LRILKSEKGLETRKGRKTGNREWEGRLKQEKRAEKG